MIKKPLWVGFRAGATVSDWEDYMEFLVTLIKVKYVKDEASLISLGANCTHVDDNYWIMEGDIELLKDEGLKFDVVGEGAVSCLGGLSREELKKICYEDLGCKI